MNDVQKILGRISWQLETLTRLVIFLGFAGRTMKEQILMLSKAGVAPKEIADILGTTSNTVNVTLSVARRKRK